MKVRLSPENCSSGPSQKGPKEQRTTGSPRSVSISKSNKVLSPAGVPEQAYQEDPRTLIASLRFLLKENLPNSFCSISVFVQEGYTNNWLIGLELESQVVTGKSVVENQSGRVGHKGGSFPFTRPCQPPRSTLEKAQPACPAPRCRPPACKPSRPLADAPAWEGRSLK